MSQDQGPPSAFGSAAPQLDPRYQIASLLRPAALARLAVIGAVVVAIAASFAAAGGWLSPGKLTQNRMIDAFEQANGLHAGFRRNHSKGVCVAGFFESNGAGARLSKASVFGPGRVPVFGRFALAAAVPQVADTPREVRSLALNFTLSDGEVWRTGMNDIPVFPFTVQGFYDQLVAARPDPATGKPDPAKMKEFAANHPETVRAVSLIGARQVSSSFANGTYHSLNAFLFVNASGTSVPVRWSMVATDPFEPAPATAPAGADKNYLFEALIARLRRGPAQWKLIVTIAKPGDPTNDATLPWPPDRETVDTGTLTLDSAATEAAGNCRDINFDPLVLPAGIAPSDDPLLSARSAAYAESFYRREGETKTPSAVTVSSAGKGS